MKNRYLRDALATNLPAVSSDDAFAIDLMDADLDAVAGGASAFCGVMKVTCETTYTVSKEANSAE